MINKNLSSREIIKKKGWSIDDLASYLNVTRRTVFRMLNNEKITVRSIFIALPKFNKNLLD